MCILISGAANAMEPIPPHLSIEVQSFSPSVETSTIWNVLDFVSEHGKKRSFWTVSGEEVSTFRARFKFEFRNMDDRAAFEKKLQPLKERLRGVAELKIR